VRQCPSGPPLVADFRLPGSHGGCCTSHRVTWDLLVPWQGCCQRRPCWPPARGQPAAGFSAAVAAVVASVAAVAVAAGAAAAELDPGPVGAGGADTRAQHSIKACAA
jgi:hypothetical protein